MKPLKLQIIKEDGSEKYIYQDCNNYWGDSNFQLYNKESPNHSWARVYKRKTVDNNLASILYGESYVAPTSGNYTINLSAGGLQIREPSRQATLYSGIHPSSITIDETYADHRRHVEMQSEYNRHMVRLAQNELERRNAQAEAERARLEEERNRPRRPWERFRDMFR